MTRCSRLAQESRCRSANRDELLHVRCVQKAFHPCIGANPHEVGASAAALRRAQHFDYCAIGDVAAVRRPHVATPAGRGRLAQQSRGNGAARSLHRDELLHVRCVEKAFRPGAGATPQKDIATSAAARFCSQHDDVIATRNCFTRCCPNVAASAGCCHRTKLCRSAARSEHKAQRDCACAHVQYAASLKDPARGLLINFTVF